MGFRFGSGSSTSGRVYAPAFNIDDLTSSYRIDPTAPGRLELAPAFSDFPTIADLIATPPRGFSHDNSSKWTLATSGGALLPAAAASAGDHNSVAHTGGLMFREVKVCGQDLVVYMHVQGTAPSSSYQGIGICAWERQATASRTCRIFVGYVAPGNPAVYSGYGATETSAAVTSGEISTGISVRLIITAFGGFSTSYHKGAWAGSWPTSWTSIQSSTNFFAPVGSAHWSSYFYGPFVINSAGTSFSGLNVKAFNDSGMGAGQVRSTRDGVGLGVSSASPEIVIVRSMPVTTSVCDTTAIRAYAARLATQRSWESGAVEVKFELGDDGLQSGGTWRSPSAAVWDGSGSYGKISARCVSNGLQHASIDLDSIPTLRTA